MLVRWTIAAVSLLAVGCASSETASGIVAGLTPASKGWVVILTVADGKTSDGGTGIGSGSTVMATLRDALLARGIAPLVSERTSMAEAIKEAKELSYDYILKATITEWEDNAMAWSGNPDSAALSVELYDLTPTLVASATHREKASSWALLSESPARFVPKLVQATLDRVFGPR